jgi:hypothetical protein
MGSLQNYVDDVQELLHDQSASSWPLPRVIARINDARLDTARDMHCVRQIVTGLQLIQGQEIYNLNGAVGGANVTAGGSNYGAGTTVPITFSAAPAGGVTALGIGNLTAGALSSITMTRWGYGYTAAPTITVGGVGSGAAAAAVTLLNPLCVISISVIWNVLQRYSLKYFAFGIFQAYFRSLGSTFQSEPGVFTHVQQTQQVYVQPPPNQAFLSDWDMIFMPQPLVNLTDVDTQVVDPWARAVQFRAAELLMYKHDFGRAMQFGGRYEERVPRIITTSGGIRIQNPYNRNFQRMVAR